MGLPKGNNTVKIAIGNWAKALQQSSVSASMASKKMNEAMKQVLNTLTADFSFHKDPADIMREAAQKARTNKIIELLKGNSS